MGKIRLGEAEQTSLDLDGIPLSVVAEQPEVTSAVRTAFADSLMADEADCGVIVGQPAKERRGDRALHVAYESGQPILLRDRTVDAVSAAVVTHLHHVRRAARETELIPLRLRAVCHPEHGVVLAAPPAVRDWTGFDRRLLRQGWQVLPTTISFVDPETGQVRSDAAGGPLGPDGLPSSLPLLAVLLVAGQHHINTDIRRIALLARTTVLGSQSDRAAILANLLQWHGHEIPIRVGSLQDVRGAARELCGLDSPTV